MASGLDSPLWIGMRAAQYANLLLIPRWLTVRIIRDLLLLLLLLLWWGAVPQVYSLFFPLFLFPIPFSPSFLPVFLALAFYHGLGGEGGHSVGECVRAWQGAL